jgi:hypothetical protein
MSDDAMVETNARILTGTRAKSKPARGLPLPHPPTASG